MLTVTEVSEAEERIGALVSLVQSRSIVPKLSVDSRPGG